MGSILSGVTAEHLPLVTTNCSLLVDNYTAPNAEQSLVFGEMTTELGDISQRFVGVSCFVRFLLFKL